MTIKKMSTIHKFHDHHLFHVQATFIDSFKKVKELCILADLAAGLPGGAGGGVGGHVACMQGSKANWLLTS